MKKTISIILVIIWMLIIFIMSSFNSSDSSNQSNYIVNIISEIFNINNLNILNLIIRKTAHFTEYLILGILIYNCTLNYNQNTITAVLICILYAFSDEIHQIFAPGRTFKFLDILIDSTGSILGILIYNYILKKINYKKHINTINNAQKTRKNS